MRERVEKKRQKWERRGSYKLIVALKAQIAEETKVGKNVTFKRFGERFKKAFPKDTLNFVKNKFPVFTFSNILFFF